MRFILVLAVLLSFARLAWALDGEPSLLENTPIGSGGIEIFAEPDRGSGRLFAVMGDFAPHIAGVHTDADGRSWVYFYLIEAGQWMGAWAPANRFDLDDNALDDLPNVAPDDLPDMPDLPFNRRAVRPTGVNGSGNAENDDASSGSVVYDVYDCVFLSGTEFQWNVVEVTYEGGVAVSTEVLEAGLTGEWRPGCPALPASEVIAGGSGNTSSETDDAPQIIVDEDGSGGGWIFGDIDFDD